MVKQERAKEIKELHSLSEKAQFLHSNLLYYRNPKTKVGAACYQLWKTLIKKVGGTPHGWRDLGHCLNISVDDLNYIMNYVQEDPVDVVLKVFRQNDNATIDKILDAFITMKRYDILKSIEDPLCEVAQYFNKDDSGYQSKSSGQRIVNLKTLPNDLPPALNKNIVIDKNPKKPKQTLTPPVPAKEPLVNDNPILFLTYTYDGLPTALNIKEYVKNWDDVPGVQLITLDDKKEELYQNPEKFIREYFEKADIIIPILTPGYLKEINSHNSAIPNTSDNLDHKYVNFIYNLIVSNYIHATGCLNKKVRSVLPQNANAGLFAQMAMYPDLMPWTYETKFDHQFKTFLKKEYS
uniref:Death domain-containing protein n=1 Tax=Heliothis virescens TaxID=7102 RepID=A0A2A4IV09_HELVI